jgi:hypothetical protein
MDSVDRYLGLAPSGLPGMLAPTGHHHDAHDTHVSGAAASSSIATAQPDPAARVSQEA